MSAASMARAACAHAPGAQTISFGAESAKGPIDIQDREDTDAGAEGRLVRRTVITIPTEDLPSVARLSVVTVGSTQYRVRDIRLLDDGLVRELICVEV